MKKLFSLALAATALLGTQQAMATAINFDDLAAGTTVTNQYASATFSSDAGNHLAAFSFAALLGSSVPNVLGGVHPGSATNGGFAELIVDFTAPVNNLGFLADAVNSTGTAALIDVYVNNTLSSTVNLVGLGTPATPLAVDLSAFGDVTKIRVYAITDAGGLAYDDFQFNSAAAVPEPATLALFATGLAGFRLRRRAPNV
jgi:hypothetical protein